MNKSFHICNRSTLVNENKIKVNRKKFNIKYNSIIKEQIEAALQKNKVNL